MSFDHLGFVIHPPGRAFFLVGTFPSHSRASRHLPACDSSAVSTVGSHSCLCALSSSSPAFSSSQAQVGLSSHGLQPASVAQESSRTLAWVAARGSLLKRLSSTAPSSIAAFPLPLESWLPLARCPTTVHVLRWGLLLPAAGRMGGVCASLTSGCGPISSVKLARFVQSSIGN